MADGRSLRGAALHHPADLCRAARRRRSADDGAYRLAEVGLSPRACSSIAGRQMPRTGGVILTRGHARRGRGAGRNRSVRDERRRHRRGDRSSPPAWRRTGHRRTARMSIALIDYGAGNLHSVAQCAEGGGRDRCRDHRRCRSRGARRPHRAARRRRVRRLRRGACARCPAWSRRWSGACAATACRSSASASACS